MAEQPLAKRGPAATPSPTTLNDLPQEVLIRILTLLPLIYAIKTSPISKKWRNLWHSLPSLKFKSNQVSRNPTYVTSQTLQLLSDFISQVLLNRPNNLPFHKFSLRFHYSRNHRYRSLVTSWLLYALNCEVTVLKLDFRVDPVDRDENGEDDGSEGRPHYDFHFCHLRNNTSVRFLMLCRCKILVPSDGLLRFRSIMRLELADVDVADEVLSDLVSRCESLEKLVLSQFRGLRKFRIVSGKLKDLELSCYYVKTREDLDSSVEICAPNLSKIKIDCFYVKNYKGDLSSVVDAELEFRKREGYAVVCWINSMKLLTGVERLSVQNYLPKASFHGYKVSPFAFDIPSLEEVKMTNFKNTEIERHVLTLLGSERVVLNKVVVVPAKLEKASLKGPIIIDLTAYRDRTSVIAALQRLHYIPEK